VSETDQTIEITVDGDVIEAQPGELVIDACERGGTYIPRFCHHSRLQPVGMCRMCLVEVDTGRGPALQPSCMLECVPGMEINTVSERTQKAQDGVLEFLLTNHPLDCPVCDKGGECPLQDMTMAFGPGESRFVEEKRHFEKPIPINENVFLDRERCILCDRCTRFADDVAGDSLIHFQGRGSHTEVNTFPDEPFRSYFSGNTVQICPVGALTAVPYRFKARPWDLSEVESTSVVDSVGSRIAVQSSHDRVLRFQGVDADTVNWGWLSDKERFIFEAYDNSDRLLTPFLRDSAGDLVSVGWGEALGSAADALSVADPDRVAVIGGSRLSNESQYAWAKLVKGVIGSDHVDAQLGDGLPADFLLGLPRATIDEACQPGGLVILLGPDPKEELGSLYLRLRHAVIHDGVQIIELTPRATGLTPLAAHSLRIRPGEATDVVRAIFGEGGTAPVGGITADEARIVGSVISEAAIAQKVPVTVLLGRQSLAEDPGTVVDAAFALHERIADVRFLSLLRRGNVHGAIDMGLSPGLLPGRVLLDEGRSRFTEAWGTTPDFVGRDTLATLKAAAGGNVDVLILLGADVLADFPDAHLARKGLEGAKTVVALDLFATPTTCMADVVLPSAAPTEIDGSFTNLEGRVSVISRKVTSPGTARPDWMIAVGIADLLGVDLGIKSPADVLDEIADVSPLHAHVTSDSLAAATREGLLVEGTSTPLVRSVPLDVPSHDKNSFRLVVTRSMYDQGVLVAHSPSLAGLAPMALLGFEPTDFSALGVVSGGTISVRGPQGPVDVQAMPDPKVTKGTAHVLFNQLGVAASELIDATGPVVDLTVVPI